MFDKITARVKKLCYGFDPKQVDPVVIAQKVVVCDCGTTLAPSHHRLHGPRVPHTTPSHATHHSTRPACTTA